MSEQAKPSVGALRAARALGGLTINTRSEEVSGAHIIDREIGLAELLEAAKTVRVWVALAIGRDPKTTHPKAIQDATKDLAVLDSAIAKAEREA